MYNVDTYSILLQLLLFLLSFEQFLEFFYWHLAFEFYVIHTIYIFSTHVERTSYSYTCIKVASSDNQLWNFIFVRCLICVCPVPVHTERKKLFFYIFNISVEKWIFTRVLWKLKKKRKGSGKYKQKSPTEQKSVGKRVSNHWKCNRSIQMSQAINKIMLWIVLYV